MENVKTGIVLEGGAMRGIFTSGVLDALMENDIYLDGMVGVSAGACFGCNYKSRQAGRGLRYNLKYCKDPRYCSVRSFLKTGNLFGANFCYHVIPNELDPFDKETYNSSPMKFYVVATDVNTGKAVYRLLERATDKNFEWIRASASMPLVSGFVKIDGYTLLDGGIADSIPLRFFEREGYERNVVVLTQPRVFTKKNDKSLPLVKKAFRRYPEFVKSAEERPDVYNKTRDYVFEREKEGSVFVICPDSALDIGKVEHDPEKIQAVYDTGRNTALRELERLKEFLR